MRPEHFNVGQESQRTLFVCTATAKTETYISFLSYCLSCTLYQSDTNCIYMVLAPSFWQNKTSEPVEQIVYKAVDMKPVAIDYSLRTAHTGKSKSVFAFLNKALHFVTAAAELNYPICIKVLHHCYDESKHMGYLVNQIFSSFLNIFAQYIFSNIDTHTT